MIVNFLKLKNNFIILSIMNRLGIIFTIKNIAKISFEVIKQDFLNLKEFSLFDLSNKITFKMSIIISLLEIIWTLRIYFKMKNIRKYKNTKKILLGMLFISICKLIVCYVVM